MTAAGVRRAWDGFVAVLATHAPVSHAAIRPPRPDVGAALDRAEAALGVDLGEDLRTYFARHDGTDPRLDAPVFPDGFLLGVDDAVELSLMVFEIWNDNAPNPEAVHDPAGTVAATWLPQYLFYADDTCGNGGFVDLRAGERHGCVRHWWKADNDMDDLRPELRRPDSLVDLLTDLTEAIATGRGRIVGPDGDVSGRVVDGAVVWHGI